MATGVWGIVILFATIMHLRYEYYASVVIVLFSAITLSSLYAKIADSEQPTVRIKKNVLPVQNPFPLRATAIVGILILLIAAFSAQTINIVVDKQIGAISISSDWSDTLVWLSENSPDSGVDYLKIYEKTDFSYPKESYGILSWWDYGHWITFLTKRIPIASPFQDNVRPVAKFLSAQNEEEAESNAIKTGAKYVITDYATVTTKFAALPLWAYGNERISSYQQTYYQQSMGSGMLDPVLVLKQPYFASTATRMHLFDGSFSPGKGGSLLTLGQAQAEGGSVPVITRTVEITPAEAARLPPSESLQVSSLQFTHPITDVPALGHYRLIYESPSTVAKDDTRQIKEVKIFERVNGFTLPGTGTIELPLTTNQGRNFTWIQQSRNNTFTLPYSTQNNPYDVHATGPYRIIETGKTIEVEEAWLH